MNETNTTRVADGAGASPVIQRGDGLGNKVLDWISRLATGVLLTATVAAVVVVAMLVGSRHFSELTPVELFAIWILAFLPCWLYFRFVRLRAGTLWQEFVLNLHRLGLDEPQNLPEPPKNSSYHRPWVVGGGKKLPRDGNIYRQKFEAYYGRGACDSSPDASVKAETMFPVVLATAIFAVGWTTMFWSDTLVSAKPTSAFDMLACGFLGAYLFNLQMLTRRYFQRDLKPSAYVSAVVRIVIVAVVVVMIHQLPLFDGESRHEALVAFVIGMFPLVGMQLINRTVALVLKRSIPSLESAYPLNQLDGLNIWYEARLMEEGIEDMQNLVSSNVVEVLLHTRVPVGRLVDWFDQAHLYLLLSPVKHDERYDRGSEQLPMRVALSSIGVRTATGFLTAFPPDDLDDSGNHRDPLSAQTLAVLSDRTLRFTPPTALMVSRLLANEYGLEMVKNWRMWSDRERPRTGGDALPTDTTAMHADLPLHLIGNGSGNGSGGGSGSDAERPEPAVS
jgi:hypothetical protein